MITSIRDFGGELADSPIWIFIPKVWGNFSEEEQGKFVNLKANIIPYDAEADVLKFPFGTKVQAAAIAEEMSLGQTEFLIWLDSDSLVLNAPTEMILPKEKILGYRPVHHKLIGSAWGEALGPFWEMIYQECQVPRGTGFPMKTHVGEEIWPYFNAGTFVIRPEIKLLTQWWKTFQKCFRTPAFSSFYEKDTLYAIFMHQAILTGVILGTLEPEKVQELSNNINYPLHLHHDIPASLRPNTINELITARHENIFDGAEWRQNLPITEPLISWIEAQPRVQNSTEDSG